MEEEFSCIGILLKKETTQNQNQTTTKPCLSAYQAATFKRPDKYPGGVTTACSLGLRWIRGVGLAKKHFDCTVP